MAGSSTAGSGYGNSAAGGGPPYSGNPYPSTHPNTSPSAGFQYNQHPASRGVNNPNQTGAATGESGSSSATSPGVAGQTYPGADASGDANPGMSEFNQKLARTLQHTIEWGFFWLWLLLLLYLAYRLWKWHRQREAKLWAKMAESTAEAYGKDDSVD